MLICLRFCQDRRQRELDANPRDNPQQITYAIVAPNAETTNIFLELAKSNEIARVEKNSKKSSKLASPRVKRKASDWFLLLTNGYWAFYPIRISEIFLNPLFKDGERK